MLTISCSAVFQAGGLLVVIVEVPRSPHLACLVPVIVNAILNEHQIVVDIVAFVNKGNFPRSRLGEKQRGTILAKWVKRSLQTEAQFAIRNSDFTPMEGGPPGGEGIDLHRTSLGSLRSGGPPGATSLRNMEPTPQILEQGEADQAQYGYNDRFSMQAPPPSSSGYAGPPLGMDQGSRYSQIVDDQRPGSNAGFSSYGQGPAQQVPVGYYNSEPIGQVYDQAPGGGQYGGQYNPAASQPMAPPPPPPKPVVEMPSATGPSESGTARLSHQPPQIRLPGVDGRESLDLWGDDNGKDDDWKADAIMHMNLAGDLGRSSN